MTISWKSQLKLDDPGDTGHTFVLQRLVCPPQDAGGQSLRRALLSGRKGALGPGVVWVQAGGLAYLGQGSRR